MPSELKGAGSLKRALRTYDKDLSKELRIEMVRALKPITLKARGYAPSNASVLSNMLRQNEGRGFYRPFPAYNETEAKAGIKYSSSPTRPNKAGFSYAASIYNSSAPGAIAEVAGRKSGMNGRPVNPMVKGYRSASDKSWSRIRATDKSKSSSYNPDAGRAFIAALGGELKQIHTQRRGRPSHKRKGRMIFRAWAEDNGKTNAAVIKALENAANTFRSKVGKA